MLQRSDALKTWVKAKYAWLLCLAGLLLLLPNLGNIYLWQDEAETALLSQRLGAYGLPLAFDGRNLIRQAPEDIQYTADYVWVYHPWLPFYATGLSFALLGPTTFAARLPFALAGLGTVVLFYFSLRHHFRDERIAMLGATLLLLCVPFLLHARQCKYFAFAALFAVASLDSYLRLRQAGQAHVALPYFILSGFCLFQSNFGAFLPLMASLGVNFVLSRPTLRQVGQMVLASVILAGFVVPWAVYLQTWARGRFFFDIYRFAGHLAHYTVYITGWVLPWPLLVPFGYVYFVRRNRGLNMSAEEFPALSLFIAVVVITVLFLSLTFIWMYFSYIVQLVPLLMAMLAVTLLRIWDRSRLLGFALIVLLVTTNLLHLFPYVLPVASRFRWASLAPRRYLAETDALIATAGRLHFDLADYFYELTHDYDGPDEGMVLFLQANAAPGDIVLTNYGELPIAFYTGLDIAGGLGAYRVGEIAPPRWVIDRREGPYRSELEKVIASGSYEAVDIPYPDILWGNRPVPEYHKFATVRDVPDVVIHRRVD